MRVVEEGSPTFNILGLAPPFCLAAKGLQLRTTWPATMNSMQKRLAVLLPNIITISLVTPLALANTFFTAYQRNLQITESRVVLRLTVPAPGTAASCVFGRYHPTPRQTSSDLPTPSTSPASGVQLHPPTFSSSSASLTRRKTVSAPSYTDRDRSPVISPPFTSLSPSARSVSLQTSAGTDASPLFKHDAPLLSTRNSLHIGRL